MAKPTANLRLFVAAYPPLNQARRMLDALGAIDALPPHRPTREDQVHLTIQFVGDVPVKDMDQTVESVQRAASGLHAFTLTPQRLISLPRGNRPRLVALETDAPAALLELQRRLAQRLASNVRRKPGDKYLPHITLCRYRQPNRRSEEIDLPTPDLAPFDVREIKLMRSKLTNEGAIHEVTHTVTLEPIE